MKVNLKKLNEQVIVITGATSGIGLATARMAAKKGAKVVISGRSDAALRTIEQELKGSGADACAVEADVTKEDDLRRLAQEAKQHFGGFDTWVNNAGVGMYGRALEIPVDDQRQLFETNFWGIVYGCRVAVEQLRQRGGGALINLGSVVSDRAIPLLGPYSASKAAVKSYTDAIRMELEEEEAPISVTLIQPASIDTPFPQHAPNYMDAQPRLAGPVYAPHLVAEAILDAAQHPVRDLMIGGAAKAMSTMGKYAPRLTDKYMEKTMFEQQKRKVATARKPILRQPSEDVRERGHHDGKVWESSPYTKAARNPMRTAALAVGTGLAVAAIMTARRNTQSM